MEFISYKDGLFTPTSELVISPFHAAFTRGYCAFEALRTYGGAPFYLNDHVERLLMSAEALHLDCPFNVHAIIEEVIERNPKGDLLLRIYLSEDEAENPSLLILVQKLQPPQESIAVMTTRLSRQFPRVKSTNYLSAMIALKEAKEKGCDEVLYRDADDRLLELTKANFFGVWKGVLYTAGEGVLLGITRHIVLELADAIGLDVREEALPYSAVAELEEAFLTATTKEIVPIIEIDGHPIARGPIAKTLQNAFSAHVHRFA